MTSIISETVNIKNNGKPTTEYIESELKKLGINPLRWAVVEVTDEYYKINTANLKGEI